MPSIARIATIVGALLIDVIVTIGFVGMSLGIRAEGQPGVGQVRPPPPMPAASATQRLHPPVAPAPDAPEPGSPPRPARNVESVGPVLSLARTDGWRPHGAGHLPAATIGPLRSESEG
jgi:hypothetical protein